MSLQTPTVAEISDNIISQLESTLSQTIPLLPKAFNRVLAKALGAVFILVYKYSSWSFLQQFVATASNDVTTVYGREVKPLQAWGNLIGVTDQTPATRAELTVAINVINQTGSLPTQTQLLSDDNGVTYLTIGSVLLDAAVVYATIRASSDQAGGGGAGEIGLLVVGAKVNFINPLADVQKVTTVTAQTVTGADAESVEVYRTRILDAFSARPQGGAYSDYRIWCEAVSGVESAYPYTGDPGEVDIYIESSTETDGIPTQAQLDAAYDATQVDDDGLATRRPVGSMINTLPITRTEFDVTVEGISETTRDVADVEDDIETALEQYFLNREPFISGLDVPPRRDRVQKAEVEGTVIDIVSGAGGVYASVAVVEGITPIFIRNLVEGEKAKLGGVTFI